MATKRMATKRNIKFRVIYHEFWLIFSVFVVTSLFFSFYAISELPENLDNLWLASERPKRISIYAEPYGQFGASDEELNTILGQRVDYWEDWNWQNKMIEGRVRDIDVYNSELAIYVTRPVDAEFSRRVNRMYVRCPERNTIAVRSFNPTVSSFKSGFNVVEEASLGDVLYAYCLDEECLNIGGGCILTVF